MSPRNGFLPSELGNPMEEGEEELWEPEELRIPGDHNQWNQLSKSHGLSQRLKAAIIEPAWVYPRSSAYVTVIGLVFCGTPDSGLK